MNPTIAKTDTSHAELERLSTLAEDVIARCRAAGADQAEVGASVDVGLNVSVRLGDIETIEHTRVVYFMCAYFEINNI